MLKLIVNPGTDAAWEIPLRDGFHTLGSDASAGHPIEHPSVSESHCQVFVAGSEVQVQDLGSAQGTFVNGARVEQFVLKPGQRFRVGEVDMEFVADNLPPLPPPIPTLRAADAAPAAAARARRCKHHPKSPGNWRCEKCQADFCDLCVSLRRVGGATQHFCRKCGGACTAIPRELIGADAEPEPDFFRLLPQAFRYPVQGNGLILLVAGTVVFGLLSFAQRFAGFAGPYGAVAALIIAVFMTGYLFNYAKRVVATSAAGEAEVPDWPDFGNWTDDILMPCGQLIALLVLTFGPAMILRWWQPGGEVLGRVAFITALGLGALFAPMALLALSMFDSITVLNPVALAWSILRIPLRYLVAAAAFEIVTVGWFYSEGLLRWLLPVPLLPGVISSLFSFYALLVGMRILGLLYFSNKEQLGWN